MITAWSLSGVQRSRSTAALWRVLGLGLFLFGLLYTHTVSPDATVRHIVSGEGATVSFVHFEPVADHEKVATATSAVRASERPDAPSGDHHDGHGQHHAGGECALGQPPQGPGLAVPCLTVLSSESDDHGVHRSVYARQAAARDIVAPIAHAADSAVLRI
ncbi:hypothetical protein AQJ46_12170 [Streptomyces canus]|uniref:Uncharacterized protein n=1 Tax=Streptomyces canus TaxID=58343 RepID=A0A101SFB3_9ACTN|nr:MULTISPECIES: hypothetical protein [Streptomyces]KUN72578.1 hypothetical protein AQJ46_12170 [Streptomyces canus]MDI5912537.1 hypothetical protein [Streptomyces sp. 12257]